MRTNIVLALLLLLLFHSAARAQQTFIFTASASNINGFRAAIDNPSLNNDPDAIILATPISTAGNEYQHPFAVWYLAGKWNVFNSDQVNMVAGTQFQIQFWTKPDATHFVHKATQQNVKNGMTRIDNPALDNHPKAYLIVFQSMSNVRGDIWNASMPQPRYADAEKKWYIENFDGKPINAGNAYNVVIYNAGLPDKSDVREPTEVRNPGNSPTLPLIPPVTTGVAGAAGGDLTGNYPDPLVKGIRGRPISNAVPAVGATLRWNGSEWAPVIDATPTQVQPTDSAPAGSSGLIQTSFRAGELSNWSAQFGNGTKYDLTPLGHSISVSKRSRLIISAAAAVLGPTCALPCNPAAGFLYVSVDGNVDTNVTGYSSAITSLGALDVRTLTISNYMFDVMPGTHTVKFAIRHSVGTSGLKARPTYSSVIVIPLE